MRDRIFASLADCHIVSHLRARGLMVHWYYNAESIRAVLHSILSSGEVEPQRHGTAYRRVRPQRIAPFDTRFALLRMLCERTLRCNTIPGRNIRSQSVYA